jgi:hypothetical protein
MEEDLSIKEKKAGTAYRCSLKTGHFYFSSTQGKATVCMQT